MRQHFLEPTTHVHDVKRVTYMALLSPFPRWGYEYISFVSRIHLFCFTNTSPLFHEYSFTRASARPMCTMSKESLTWLSSAHSLRVPNKTKETNSYEQRDEFVRQQRHIHETKESLKQLSSAHPLYVRNIHMTKQTYS